jgi:hypothetical protein
MSIASTTRKAGPFTGNGLTTIFPFTFKVFQASDLLVVRTDLSGIETTLTLTTDYTVSLNANQDSNPGGTITAISAPASGFLLTMTSNVPELQPVVLTNMGGFYPRVINDALDRLTIFTQQISEKLGRALTLPLSAPSGVSTQLPFPAANKIIAWNESANGLQSMDPSELATVVAFGTANADIFSGTGSQTAFTLTASPGALNNLDVSISGVTQKPGLDYTWSSGTTITFTSAPPVGTNNVLARYLQGLPQGSSDSASATFIQAGTGAVTRTAQSKMREFVSVLDFGAVAGSSAATNNAAFAAALLYCTISGKRLYVPAGTYALSQSLSTSGNLHLFGDGDSTVLDFSGTVSGGSYGLNISGSLDALPAISNAYKGNLSITFASAPSLSIGDVFVIYNPTDYSWSGARAYYRAGEWCEVSGVSGNVVSLSNPLFDSYVGAAVNVYKMTSPSVSLKDFRIKGTTVLGLIQASLCNRPLIENVSGYHENDSIVYFDRCYKPTGINLNLHNKGTGTGDDYGLVIGNSQHVRILGGNFYARRHGITHGGGDFVGCVAVRDSRVVGATIKNDINSGTHAADFHGNTEASAFDDCTIYQGVSWQGKNNRIINSSITDMLGGMCLYSSEIKGGFFSLENCELTTYASPSSIGRGVIDVGGNSNAITTNSVEDMTFRIRGCTLNGAALTSSDSALKVINRGSTKKINIDIDGFTAINITALNSISYLLLSSGTADSSFLIVDNIANFPNGSFLINAFEYANFPQRMMEQTGKVALSASSGVSFAASSTITFKHPYARTPVANATAGNEIASVYNGNRAVFGGIRTINYSSISLFIESGDATAWTSTKSTDVSWSVKINDTL